MEYMSLGPLENQRWSSTELTNINLLEMKDMGIPWKLEPSVL